MTDEQLRKYIADAQNGDSEATMKILDEFEQFRSNQVKRYSTKGLDYDDVKQEVDTLMCTAIMNYDPAKDPSPVRHITTFTKVKMWTYYRKEKNFFRGKKHILYPDMQALEKILESRNIEYYRHDDTEDIVIDSLVAEELLTCLSDREKECVIMYYMEDKTQQEIADYLNVDQATVSRAIASALEKLFMVPEGLSE